MHSILSRLKLSLVAPCIKTSCMALLGLARPTPAVISNRMEEIRQLMLDELGDEGEKKFPAVTRRIRYAQDIQALWYVRSEVMAILATTHGEAIAREKMVSISGRFKSLLPKGLVQRTGPRSK